MRNYITCLFLGLLLAILPLLSFGQQNQITQKPNPEIEALKNRILVLESKLQIVENVEKIQLAAKLAEAQAKLRSAEFGKFERELRDANNEWLRTWSLWFVGIIGFLVLIVGGAFWFWLRSRADQLIADTVEKSLNGFKEAVAQVEIVKKELKAAVGQVNILQDQIRIMEKDHAVSVLADSVHLHYSENIDSGKINPIPDRALLDLLADKTRDLSFRYKAVEVLVDRKSVVLVHPALELLNSVVGSDIDWKNGWFAEYRLSSLVDFLGDIHTQEVYEGLKKILDRLLSTEDQMLKRVLLARTTFSLARVSGELNTKDSVSLLKMAIPVLEIESLENQDLIDLFQHFDKFNEPEGIKEFLTHHAANGILGVENRCLELLQKYDPDFVNQWRAQKETANTQTEESS